MAHFKGTFYKIITHFYFSLLYLRWNAFFTGNSVMGFHRIFSKCHRRAMEKKRNENVIQWINSIQNIMGIKLISDLVQNERKKKITNHKRYRACAEQQPVDRSSSTHMTISFSNIIAIHKRTRNSIKNKKTVSNANEECSGYTVWPSHAVDVASWMESMNIWRWMIISVRTEMQEEKMNLQPDHLFTTSHLFGLCLRASRPFLVHFSPFKKNCQLLVSSLLFLDLFYHCDYLVLYLLIINHFAVPIKLVLQTNCTTIRVNSIYV